MIVAILSITLLGAVLGIILGIANKFLQVEGNPLVEELITMMPGSNCGQCGMAGCSAAAAAIAEGTAPVTCCPPGGKMLATALAERMGVTFDLGSIIDEGPRLAQVSEDICIGCCRCLKVCPTDAIVGAAKQIHNVIREACTGCGACIDRCPTGAMTLVPVPATLQHWIWPKPAAVAAVPA